MTEPKSGFFYHYKNPEKLYFVLGCANNRTTGEREVVYLACYENDQRLHTRNVEEWNQKVFIHDPYDQVGDKGELVPRFTRVETPSMFWTDYLEDAFGAVMGEFLL